MGELGRTQEAIEVLKVSLRHEKNAETEKLLRQYTDKVTDNSVPRQGAIKIAHFSNLNTKKKELQGQLKTVQDEMQSVSDAIEELEVCIDDDSALLMVGDVFLPVEDEEAEEFATNRQKHLNGE